MFPKGASFRGSRYVVSVHLAGGQLRLFCLIPLGLMIAWGLIFGSLLYAFVGFAVGVLLGVAGLLLFGFQVILIPPKMAIEIAQDARLGCGFTVTTTIVPHLPKK